MINFKKKMNKIFKIMFLIGILNYDYVLTKDDFILDNISDIFYNSYLDIQPECIVQESANKNSTVFILKKSEDTAAQVIAESDDTAAQVFELVNKNFINNSLIGRNNPKKLSNPIEQQYKQEKLLQEIEQIAEDNILDEGIVVLEKKQYEEEIRIVSQISDVLYTSYSSIKKIFSS
jgi:hypothetical protein